MTSDAAETAALLENNYRPGDLGSISKILLQPAASVRQNRQETGPDAYFVAAGSSSRRRSSSNGRPSTDQSTPTSAASHLA
jgi:hypothetical protein